MEGLALIPLECMRCAPGLTSKYTGLMEAHALLMTKHHTVRLCSPETVRETINSATLLCICSPEKVKSARGNRTSKGAEKWLDVQRTWGTRRCVLLKW